MKTSEFKKQVSELGFKALASNIYMTVYNDKNDIIGMISVGCPFVVDTDQPKFLSLSEQDRKGLLKLLVEYAETPLAEREDEKKYYVKVPHTKNGWYFKGWDGKLGTICQEYKKLWATFTESDIERYGLQDCEKVECDNDEQ